MANINNFLKQSGDFLKAEMVKVQPKAKISGSAEVSHNDKFDRDELHVPVTVADKQYIFNCSKTNARTIASVLGEDTDKWINASLEFEVYKTKTSDGKMTDAINVKSVFK